MAKPPAIWKSEVTVRCPRGTKHVTLVGPTAGAAVRKATELDARKYGFRCHVEAVRLVKRGPAAGIEAGFEGARRGRRRRKSRR